MSRSLYECANARVLGDRIYCAKGYQLGPAKDGTIPISRLQRGEPLQLKVCSDCADFRCNGKPIARKERGWKS